MLDLESWSTIVFIAVLVIIAIIDRKHIEFKYGVLIRKTKRGKKWIYDVGERHRRFLKIFSTIGVAVAFVASIVSFYFLLQSGLSIITRPDMAKPGVQIIIPKVPSQAVCTYALCVPFWFWIIGVLTVLFSHELMHAFVSRAEKIRLKSFGFLSLLVLPGAFVEPDDKQLKKSRSMTKFRILAAGSFGNLIIVLISTLIIMGYIAMLNNMFDPNGVRFDSLISGTPADQVKLSGVITEVNGQRVNSLQEFVAIMDKTKPGDRMEIKTTDGIYTLVTVKSPDNPDKGFIGVKDLSTKLVYRGLLTILGEPSNTLLSVLNWFLNLFMWINFLNLGVGLVNLLPIKPLDGGLMFEELFRIILKRDSHIITVLSIITFGLIVINIIGPSLINYFTSVLLSSNILTG